MSHDSRLQVLDRHLAAENAHDLAGTLATLTADCEFVDAALGMRWSGHDGAAAQYTMWWNAFDLRVIGERLHLPTSRRSPRQRGRGHMSARSPASPRPTGPWSSRSRLSSSSATA